MASTEGSRDGSVGHAGRVRTTDGTFELPLLVGCTNDETDLTLQRERLLALRARLRAT